MTSDQFKAWRKGMGYTQVSAAAALGLVRESIINYERGERREGGAVIIPKAVALACMALRMGVTDFVET